MPRSKDDPTTFIAGMLPKVTINKSTFFVDGRLKELRNTKDFFKKVNPLEERIWNKLSKEDKDIISYEFTGQTTN